MGSAKQSFSRSDWEIDLFHSSPSLAFTKAECHSEGVAKGKSFLYCAESCCFSDPKALFVHPLKYAAWQGCIARCE